VNRLRKWSRSARSGLREWTLRLAEWLVARRRAIETMKPMSICPICESEFDEQAYQLVIKDLGAFDSIACAEEALRRHSRRARGELADALADAVRAADPDGLVRALRPGDPAR
jgi:DNA-binding SARP family transcriptional activator